MASLASRHTFTVHEWQEMGRVGLFDEDARVELIDGEIVDMAPIGAKHQDCVDRLTAAMVRLVGDDAVVRVQGSIRLGERSEPQPDLALLRRRHEGYAAALPGASDVLLVVEVADTTLERDRAKADLYAASGVPECWIIDLPGEQVIALGRPGPGGYAEERVARGEDALGVASLGSLRMRAGEVLGG